MGLTTMIKPEEALKGRSAPLKITNKHFVLGTPMLGPWPENMEVVVFANGCFWGSEKGIWRLPGGGIHSTAVGYAASYTPNPTYSEVCGGRTGASEAVQVVFDPEKISLVDILRWFWESHDPTCGMGQGMDTGTQYRSGLYYLNDEQKAIMEASKAAYEKALKDNRKGKGSKITTEIAAANDFDTVFYYAEDYHQQYLAKPGARPYCSAQPQQVSLPPYQEWVPISFDDKVKEQYAPKLPDRFWKEYSPKPHCVIKSPNMPIVLSRKSPFREVLVRGRRLIGLS